MASHLSLTCDSTILDVPATGWDELAKGNFVLRHGYLHAIEKSGLPDMNMRYFRWFRDGQLIAIAAGAVWELDLREFLQHKFLRSILRIGACVPGLVRWRVLTIGPPSGVGPAIAVRDDVEHAEMCRIFKLLWRRAKTERLQSIFLRDFFETRHPVESALSQSGFSVLMYDPVAVLPVRWTGFDDYVADLRTDYRKKLLRIQKEFAKSGIRIEVSSRPLAPWPDYERLFQNVFDHAKSGQRMPIGPNYFRTLDRYFSDHTVWIQYFLGDELVAFTQNVFFGNVLHNRFVGMDYSVSREWRVYFHSYYDVIDLAIRRGARTIYFGLTNYGPKSAFGCSIVPRRAFVGDRRRLIGPVFVNRVRHANQPEVSNLRHALRDRSHQQLWDGKCQYWDEMK